MSHDPINPGRPAKYPWGALAVGESREVLDVPNRNAMYASLHQWRDSVLASDLGYSREHAPLFTCSWDAQSRRAVIRRLPDGPILPGHQSLVARERTQAAREAAARVKYLTERYNAYHDTVYYADLEGLPRPMVPLDLLELAKEHAPHLAQALADLNCRPRSRRPAAPSRLEHNAEPDTPADRHFARKLVQAAQKIRSDKPT